MTYSAADLVLVGGASFLAGGVNALAGGGTLISFPALIAAGVPALPANVTNTVSLCPGYLSGTMAQREDLDGQSGRLKRLALVGLAGGVAGAAILQITPEGTFKEAVPWLLILSCVLLLAQNHVRRLVDKRPRSFESHHASASLMVTTFAAAVYGGFFGAGLGILLLAVLGLFLEESLQRLNALKQALSLVVNVCAASFFAATGHVRWELVPLMAIPALVGGHLGGRLVRVVNPTVLRLLVVALGVGVAIQFWV